MKLTRSEPIHFQRHDDTVIIAPAVTRAQMREVFALDRERTDDESPLDSAARRGQQVAIFLRHAEWMQSDGTASAGPLSDLLDALTVAEEIDIIHAFIAQHHGIEPTTAVAVQQAMREELKKKHLEPTPPKT